MMALAPAPSPATAGYDCLAPFYDRFTSGYAYDAWIDAIEARAISLGLRGRRALDLACGTGKSTLPLLERGYRVRACDISEGMVREARRKLPEGADVFTVADMRDLPDLGQFDFVLCLDDAINYLLSDAELEAAFAGVARLLAPGGVLAFDVNSLLTYRTCFAETAVHKGEDVVFVWRGEATPSLQPGEGASAEVEIRVQHEDGVWERRSMRHTQRHHPIPAIASALERAGLQRCVTLGQHPGARLEEMADERRHIKLVHFATRCGDETLEGGDGVETVRP